MSTSLAQQIKEEFVVESLDHMAKGVNAPEEDIAYEPQDPRIVLG